MNKFKYQVIYKGIVQGVGFRPFIYRNAIKYNLFGTVKNTPYGVIVEIEGEQCDEFIEFTKKFPPPISKIDEITVKKLPVSNFTEFKILKSDANDKKSDKGDILIPPDIALCQNCKKELFDSDDPRYLYPFINCTDCGPRFTIIKGIPYDRPKTTMKKFKMCPECHKEYTNPLDRRYHAQPVSCYNCGPRLSFIDKNLKEYDNPIDSVCKKLIDGEIVAIKGLGGYHLACNALNEDSISKLRKRKNRGNKPFALMGNLEMIKNNCKVSKEEIDILSKPSSPILILQKKDKAKIPECIAPGINKLGFMIPYTPLHYLIIEKCGIPLVMTSANSSSEPIIYNDDYNKIFHFADYILSNNRDIHSFTDDSVAMSFNKKIYMIRRSRGFVPFPVKMPIKTDDTILSLGGYMKNTFTFYYKQRAIMSQYIGTIDSPTILNEEKKAIKHFQNIFSLKPTIIAIDAHPGYPNKILTSDFPDSKIVTIQHHQAHIASCMAENGLTKPVIGISMDGTGYGDDGKIWGGEFFAGNYSGFERFAHLDYNFLPSGDKSVLEPWRFALSILNKLNPKKAKLFSEKFGKTGEIILNTINKSIGGIETSSCGRIFDAVSVLLGLGNFNTYDGELPSILQCRAESCKLKPLLYNYNINEKNGLYILNILPAVKSIIESKSSTEQKSLSFHYSLASGIAEVAKIGREKFNLNDVVLSGGVFQNLLLLKMVFDLLSKYGFSVYVHKEIPANDSGLSLGQAIIAQNLGIIA